MSAKTIIVLCAQALFIQCVLSQCTSRAAIAAGPGFAAPYGLAAPGYGAPYDLGAAGLAAPYGRGDFAAPAACGWAGPALDLTPTSGGGLPVSSTSAIAPVGLSVASENAYEGILTAAGELPFIGTVGLEGVLPTAGAGAVNYACGNGRTAIISEGAAYGAGAYGAGAYGAGAYGAGAYAPGFAGSGYGYRSGYAGRGCGCGL